MNRKRNFRLLFTPSLFFIKNEWRYQNDSSSYKNYSSWRNLTNGIRGELASQLLFQHQKKTKGRYQLAQGQEILFEIKTKNVEVSSDWKQISFEYQLSQLGENLGEFTVNLEILKENIVQ